MFEAQSGELILGDFRAPANLAMEEARLRLRVFDAERDREPPRNRWDWARSHLRADPAFAPYLNQAEQVLQAIDHGDNVDAKALPVPWRSQTPSAMAYWADMARQNPSGLASRISLPILVLQGTADQRVSVADAEALAAAAPKAKLKLLPGLNHLLMDPRHPVAVDASVTQAIAGFLRGPW